MTRSKNEEEFQQNEIEKRYRSEARRSRPRSGAVWQRVRETNRENPDELGYDSVGDMQSRSITDETTKEVTGRVRKLLDLAKQILTVQQYNVFVMLAVKEPHLTERETARVLSVTPGRVHQLWVKAQVKLQKAYTERT